MSRDKRGTRPLPSLSDDSSGDDKNLVSEEPLATEEVVVRPPQRTNCCHPHSYSIRRATVGAASAAIKAQPGGCKEEKEDESHKKKVHDGW